MSNPLFLSPQPFLPASATEAGLMGLVPSPAIGQDHYILRGDATWVLGETAVLPNQSGKSGKVLSTDGVSSYWSSSVGPLSSSAFSGPLTGNVTGNLTGNVTGNVSGTADNVIGVVTPAHGGSGLSATPLNGQLLIGTGSGYNLNTLTAGSGISISVGSGTISIAATSLGGVTSITGTANQIIASSSTGAITLSTPQDIATSSVPTFKGVITTRTDGTYQFVSNSATRSYGIATSGTNFLLDDITAGATRFALTSAGTPSFAALSTNGYVKTAAGTGTLVVATSIPNTDITGLGTLSTQNGTFSGTSSGTNTGDQTISITGDVTAAGSQNTLTSTVTKINGQALATLATGILKNTTSTGVPSIAVAADFPTLNQDTTGNAATATNVAVTGVTGLGTGVASFLQTPTSANLSSMVVDETGSGNLVFANSPVLVTPNLDTPSVITLTNATGLPLTTGVTGTLPVANGGTGVTTSTGTGSTVLSASPTFTGTPAAPTAAVGTNTTQIATTEYVQSNRGDKYLTTSNSTNTIDNGNGKVFNCAIDLSYIPTQPVTIVYDVNNHMHGFVVSYNITTGVMVVDIDSHTGTGTYSAWTINIGGLTSVGGALLSANNLSDVASAATSRANLGVTATGQDTTYLYRANNLSDLSSVTTARTNLGLGTMATQDSTNVSISGGTLATVTLTTPTISSIINTGTLTLPNQTDTLVGRATTDVLTNKTLTSPVMTTPSLGVASATSVNKVTITAPVTGATLTIADGAILTASATATVSGTNTGDQTTISGNAGSATVLQTPRAIYGNNFDGSAALTQVIASTYGGTGSGFTKFTGPATAEKTKTLRDATDTILELGGSYTPTGTWTSMTLVTPALGTPASGNLANCTFPTLNQNTSGTASNVTGTVAVANGGTGQTTYTDGQLLIGNTSTGGLTKATLTAGSNITITNAGGAITIASTNGGASVSAGTTPPPSPTSNQLWWDSTSGALKLYYTDTDGTQWVDAFNTSSPLNASLLTGTTMSSSVVTSSLTTVGALTGGSIASGFGSINVGANSITGGAGSFTTLSATTSALVNRSGVAAPTPIVTNALQLVGNTSESTNLEIDTFAATPFIYGIRAQGTAASPAATASGNNLLAIEGRGYQTVTPSNVPGARILFQATENYTNIASGGKLLLQAVANGTTSPTTVADISSIGVAVTGALSASGDTTLGQNLTLQGGAIGALIKLNANAGVTQQVQFQQAGTNKWQLYYETANGNLSLYDSTNSTNRWSASSTGLAVTGALSATGNGTFSGNGATLTFSGTGSPTITATNSDLKLTALAASSDIIIDANRNQYQKINGTTVGLWASTGLAVTGTLTASGAINSTQDSYNTFGSAAGQGLIRIGSASPSGDNVGWLVFNTSNSQYNWRIAANTITSGALDISASTVAGGSTFTTSIAKFSSTGLAVTGVSSATSTAGGAGFSIVRTGGAPSTFTMLNSGGEIIHEYNAVGYGFNISTARVASISSTGLALTGGLSATSTISTSAGQLITTTAGAALGSMTGGSNAYFDWSDGTTTSRLQMSGGILYFGTASGGGTIYLRVNGSTIGALTSTGLAVTGTSGADGSVYSGNVNFAVSSGTTDGSYITNAGKLVASANGDDSLRLRRRSSDGSTALFYRDTTNVGNISVTTVATTFNSLSDYRRKSNVQDLTGSGEFIDALKPRTFDWDSGDKGVGFIAHEFAEVSPSSVAGEKDAIDSDGKPLYQTMQASSAEVIANLVAELQSLRRRNADIESRLATLETR